MSYNNFNKRQDDDLVNMNKNSTLTGALEDSLTTTALPQQQQQHKWIMCEPSSTAAQQQQSTLGYNCEKRPYMTIILLLSILVFIILRKSSFIKKYILSNEAKVQEQTDEEEGLMQRVF